MGHKKMHEKGRIKDKMDYKLVTEQVKALLDADSHYIPVMSNVSALLMEYMEDINWVGFYIMRDGRLVVGPFQGKVACIHIDIGKGVCGTAVQKKAVIRVENVHDFPGHIACDSASNSEIVLPIQRGEEVIGVLDIDSPLPGRFTPEDEDGLKKIADLLAGEMSAL
jgi:GAF domain-containing protein